MSTQITITLSDELYQQAERFARLANRDLATVLTDAIQGSISPVSSRADTLIPMNKLSDQEVLALTELQLEASQDESLSQLLDRQQAGQLTETDNHELQALMEIYQEGLLRKATALSEAVQRGLIPPLAS